MINWQTDKKKIIIAAIVIGAIFYFYGQSQYQKISPTGNGFGNKEIANMGLSNDVGEEESKPFVGAVDDLKTPVVNRGTGVGQVANDEEEDTNRKVVRSGSLDLIVKKTETTAQRIQELAEKMGGFTESLRLNNASNDSKKGWVVIQVPADKFNEMMSNLKKIAIRVESETSKSQDITEQYVDTEARLKNMRVEERQYQEIMKKASKVEDILRVTQRLNDVRGRIERLEARLKLLKQEVEMSTITVTMTAEGDIEVWGLYWQPLATIKQASRDMLESLAGYGDAIIRFIFAVPLILLWLATWGIGLWVVWQVGKWIKKRWLDVN